MIKNTKTKINILRKINIGEQTINKIENIIEDCSKETHIDEYCVNSDKISIKFSDTASVNIFLDRDSFLPETLADNAKKCVFAILFYLYNVCGPAIRINYFIEAKKAPQIEELPLYIQETNKFLIDKFDIKLTSLKMFNNDSSIKNLNCYTLIPENLKSNAYLYNWEDFGLDFSDIEINANKLITLMQNNKSLISIIIEDRNYSFISLTKDERERCQQYEKEFKDTVAHSEELHEKFQEPYGDSRITDKDLDKVLDDTFYVKKRNIINDLLNVFTTQYNFQFNAETLINKYKNKKEINYKDILIDILAQLNWVSFDEAFKANTENYIRNFIKDGYNRENIIIKRKKICFESIATLETLMTTHDVRIILANNIKLEQVLRTLYLFETGKYINKILRKVDDNIFQELCLRSVLSADKREFIKPVKNENAAKIKEISLELDGSLIIEFTNDEIKDDYIKRFIE